MDFHPITCNLDGDKMAAPVRADQISIPTRALRRVAWIDAQVPDRRINSLFNPEQLPLGTSVEVGELKPIGWSQPVQQYAHTDATRYSVSLPFSLRAYIDRNIPYTHVRQAEAFFRSFCYSNRPGEAPSHLIMVWPKTAHIVNTVRSVNVTFERWDTDMNIVAYRIDLTLVEIRRSFYLKAKVSDPALSMMLPDTAILTSEAFNSVGESTGRKLNVSGATSRFKYGSGGG